MRRNMALWCGKALNCGIALCIVEYRCMAPRGCAYFARLTAQQPNLYRLDRLDRINRLDRLDRINRLEIR